MPDHKWTGASRILLVGTRAGLFGVVLDAGQRYAAPRALAPAGRRQAADARALGSAITVVSRTHLVGNCESSAAYPNQCAHLHPGNTVRRVGWVLLAVVIKFGGPTLFFSSKCLKSRE